MQRLLLAWKELPKSSDVIVHASSTSRLFEMLNSKTKTSDRKNGLGAASNGGCRSLNDIMTDLNSSIASLDSAGRSEDNSSLFDGSSYTTGGSMTESMAEIAAEDMIVALRTQRAQLLERRAEMQMRIIMLEQEEQAILTGERVQPVAGVDWTRKHVNTGFSINDPSEGIGTMDEVSQLEFDVEIQKKIVHAARRLSREHGLGRNVKRERKTATQRGLLKLQELERKLQSAKRFQRPASGSEEQNESEKQKQHEHQTYYKAVSDNGYYPHFRKPRTTSSTSEDKISMSSDQYESESLYENITVRCQDTTLTSRDQVAMRDPLPPRDPASRHSSSSSIGNSADSCVRASLQMSLASDTKTLPRKRPDFGHTTQEPPSSPEPSSASSSSKEKSFFAPWSIKIDNLTTSLRATQDNMNKERKYDPCRPRAGSFKPPDSHVASRYDKTVDHSIHSYDKYLQTLRQNRQRNGAVERTIENRNQSNGISNHGNTESKRHSLDLYENKSPPLCGHVTINTVPTTHSTVV